MAVEELEESPSVSDHIGIPVLYDIVFLEVLEVALHFHISGRCSHIFQIIRVIVTDVFSVVVAVIGRYALCDLGVEAQSATLAYLFQETLRSILAAPLIIQIDIAPPVYDRVIHIVAYRGRGHYLFDQQKIGAGVYVQQHVFVKTPVVHYAAAFEFL